MVDSPIAMSRLPSLTLKSICSSLRKSCITPKISLMDTIIPNMSFGRPINAVFGALFTPSKVEIGDGEMFECLRRN